MVRVGNGEKGDLEGQGQRHPSLFQLELVTRDFLFCCPIQDSALRSSKTRTLSSTKEGNRASFVKKREAPARSAVAI